MPYPYYKNLSTADRENKLFETSRNDLCKLYRLRSVQKLILALRFKEPMDTYNPDLKKTTSEVATSLFVRVSDFRCVPYQFTGQTDSCVPVSAFLYYNGDRQCSTEIKRWVPWSSRPGRQARTLICPGTGKTHYSGPSISKEILIVT